MGRFLKRENVYTPSLLFCFKEELIERNYHSVILLRKMPCPPREVLHFWATWCAPCLAQIPMLQELHTQYHDRGFEVLGICYNPEAEADKVREFLDKQKLPWISLFDKDWEIFSRFSHGNSSIECLIDREGKVVFYRSDEELKGILEKMFP